MSWNQNQSNHSDQSQQTWTTQPTNLNSKQIRVTDVKRGKLTPASRSLMILALILICWKGGASFFNQSQSVVMQNQSKRRLLSTLHWKMLYFIACYVVVACSLFMAPRARAGTQNTSTRYKLSLKPGGWIDATEAQTWRSIYEKYNILHITGHTGQQEETASLRRTAPVKILAIFTEYATTTATPKNTASLRLISTRSTCLMWPNNPRAEFVGMEFKFRKRKDNPPSQKCHFTL